MTTQEAAEVLGINRSLVIRFVEQGRLQAVKHGRDWWIDPAEVERFKAIPRPKTGRKRIKPRDTTPKHAYHRHEHSGSRAYSIWTGMMMRCRNPQYKSWKDYGGRGITVCERWLLFENFLTDMGEVPVGKSLDRVDNNGNYEPENCRWATNQEQMRNTRRSVVLEYGGRSQVLQAWADELGISKQTLSLRLKKGWTVEEALTTPVG